MINDNNDNVITLSQLGTMAKNCGKNNGKFIFKINAMSVEELGDFLVELAECGLQWLDVRDRCVVGSRDWNNVNNIIEGLLHTGIKTCVVLR